MKKMTPEEQELLNAGVAAIEREGPYWDRLCRAVELYRASLQPKPRYEYKGRPLGHGIYDTRHGVGPMAWETCASVMNLADRYERSLREIAALGTDDVPRLADQDERNREVAFRFGQIMSIARRALEAK